MLPDELAALLAVDVVDARRLFARAQKDGVWPERAPATLRRVALDRARAHGPLPQLRVLERRQSQLDPFVKYAFETADGRTLETVRIPLEKPGRFSVCVSSQVGCALGCAFCATGLMGLVRNLEAWEIVDQVRQVRAELPEGTRVHGIVFQGMGEPLSNVDRVLRAVRLLSEPSGLAVDQRNITISTSGLPSGIRRLARELPNVRLGVSIGDARPGLRARLMPIDEAHPLDEVLRAAGEHAKASGHSPMWAYTLLAGVNDDAEAAEALARRAIDFASTYGVRPRISLIPYNDVEGAPFVRSAEAMLTRFRDVLGGMGLGSIVRYSGGRDVGAACGQLVRLRRPAAAPGAPAGSLLPEELA